MFGSRADDVRYESHHMITLKHIHHITSSDWINWLGAKCTVELPLGTFLKVLSAGPHQLKTARNFQEPNRPMRSKLSNVLKFKPLENCHKFQLKNWNNFKKQINGYFIKNERLLFYSNSTKNGVNKSIPGSYVIVLRPDMRWETPCMYF